MNRFVIPALIVACLSISPAPAATIVTSGSTVEHNNVFLSNDGYSSSSMQVDLNNFAQSYADTLQFRVGAVAANSQAGQTSTSHSEIFGDWFCPNCIFTTGYNPMVDYTFHFDAWASASGGYMDLHAAYAVSTGSTLNIAFVEDPGIGPDSYVDFSATYTDQQHVTHTIPHTLTTDPSGIYRLSADFSVRESLCGPTGCIPPDCVNHPDCYSHPVFSDDQSISVTVVGDGTPQILDASHTFQTTLVSEDPNFQLVSGFDSVAAPEPQPLVLIGAALIGYVIIVRRWGRT